MDLYIAEKPSLAEAIAAVLPGVAQKTRTHITVGATVLTWCYGHLLEQVQPHEYDPRYERWAIDDLPIVPAQWRVKAVAKTSAQLAAIKGFLPKATRVIHAGDPDQEGQLIVDEVLQHLRYNGRVDRILVNDYDTSKVRAAVAAIRSNRDPQFVGWSAWALCRSRLDWLMGINLSRAFTLKAREAGYDGTLSVGRVQTPTLALIAKRDEEIAAFVPKPFYALTAALAHAGTAFKASWKPREDQPGLDEEGRLIDLAIANSLSRKLTPAAAQVTAAEAKADARKAPLPFDLEALQGAANDAFGYTAAQTLEAAQALYDRHKLTTYPRTDSRYLSVAQHADTPARLQAIGDLLPALAGGIAGANPGLRSDAFNDAKAPVHHAIVPTGNERGTRLSELSESERNVYELIARVFVAQFYPPEQAERTTIAVSIAGETFVASGRRVLAPGWTAVYKDAAPDEAETPDGAGQTLPKVTVGAALDNRGVSIESKRTTAPKHYTEKTLLRAMANIHQHVANPAAKARLREGQGIGTPATRAAIIEELKSPKRGYLTCKGKQLVSTPDARAFVRILPALTTDAGFTGMTEQTLDLVAKGSVPADAFMAKTAQLIGTIVDQAKKTTVLLPQVANAVPCPVCKQGKLRRRRSAKGFFWGCDRYAAADAPCKTSFDDARGKPAMTATGARKPAAKKAASRSGPARKSSAKKAPAKRATRTQGKGSNP